MTKVKVNRPLNLGPLGEASGEIKPGVHIFTDELMDHWAVPGLIGIGAIEIIDEEKPAQSNPMGLNYKQREHFVPDSSVLLKEVVPKKPTVETDASEKTVEEPVVVEDSTVEKPAPPKPEGVKVKGPVIEEPVNKPAVRRRKRGE